MVQNAAKALPKPKHAVRPLGEQDKDPRDFAHWKSVPQDIKEHEVKRMHSFLFNKTEDFELKNEEYLPNLLFPNNTNN